MKRLLSGDYPSIVPPTDIETLPTFVVYPLGEDPVTLLKTNSYDPFATYGSGGEQWGCTHLLLLQRQPDRTYMLDFHAVCVKEIRAYFDRCRNNAYLDVLASPLVVEAQTGIRFYRGTGYAAIAFNHIWVL